MDQAKVYLALLKKHHFWVMCGVIFITSIVVYSLGTGELADQTKKRVGEINNAKDAQEKVRRRFQPNDETISKLQGKTNLISDEVEKAWVKLYWTQRNRLLWPEDMKQFKERLDRWPDTNPVTQFDEPLRRAYHYLLYPVPVERPRFKKLIQLYQETKVVAPRKGLAEVRPQPGKPAPAVREDDMQIVASGLVRWGGAAPETSGLDNIFIYPWLKNQNPPSDLEMRYCQEDLWVYEFLLEAMAQVNAGVDVNRPEKAHLKEIVEFRIGQAAAAIPPTTNLVSDLTAILAKQGVTLTPGGAPGMEGPPGMPPGMQFPPPTEMGRTPGMGMPPGAPGGPTTPNADEVLKTGRYCDLDGKPLSAADIDTKLKEDQYRLMPVYLRLVINQQKLPTLMTVLSTAVMPMRIKQVQLFKSDAAPLAVGGPQGGGGVAPPQGASAGPVVDPRFSMDVGVEIRGMVYIYQIPNTKTFPHRVAAAALAAANPGAGVPHVNPSAVPAPVNPTAVPAPVGTAPGGAQGVPAPVTEPAESEPGKAPAPAGGAPAAGAPPAGAAPAGATPAGAVPATSTNP